MRSNQAIRYGVAITAKKRTAAGLSATIDTIGFRRCKVWTQRFSGGGTCKVILRIGSVSASTSLYASATAFSPVCITSAAQASTMGAYGWDIDLSTSKRYLRLVQSTVTGSGTLGTFYELYDGTQNPAVNAGNTATTGFASLSFSPAQP
jgi:hypothetical protein